MFRPVEAQSQVRVKHRKSLGRCPGRRLQWGSVYGKRRALELTRGGGLRVDLRPRWCKVEECIEVVVSWRFKRLFPIAALIRAFFKAEHFQTQTHCCQMYLILALFRLGI